MFRLLLLTGLLTAALHTGAATVTVDLFNIRLSGTIVSGDAERIVAEIAAIQPIGRDNYLLPFMLTVDSQGGDVDEALRLAALVKVAHLEVVVPNRGVCASACFFVYLAGQSRAASGADEIRIEGASRSLGAVGVHRPYYQRNAGGPKAAIKQEELMSAVIAILKNERVPQALVDEMMARPSSELHWLDARDLRMLGRYRAGVEEELIRNCGYSRRREDSMSPTEFFKDQKSGVGACVRGHLAQAYNAPRAEAFSKMRAGWRPW